MRRLFLRLEMSLSRHIPFLRSVDQVVEIRAHSRGGVILSHINYAHLERVRTARSRDAVRSDATRVGLFERRRS